jgi:Tannase and feruloyl esterase
MKAETFPNHCAVMVNTARIVSRRRLSCTVLPAALIGFVLTVSAPVFAASCQSLSGLKLANTTITSAAEVRAGEFTPPGHAIAPARRARQFGNFPAFCRVTATVKPVADSDIRIEVWMPVSGWNGKFLGVGNGGWAGSINYGGLAQGVAHGFATASTDTGHEGKDSDASFAFGHPEKWIDMGYRAVHEMTAKGKAVAAAFYGKPARVAYWNGCSTGGRQGLMEAQRYPRDYNGIAEGDPANALTHLMFAAIWPAEFTLKSPAGYIPPEKYLLIHNAALKACDGLDGVTDGIINDPTRCHFDPGTLACKGKETSTCLTATQVESARMIYAGPRNPRTGEQIFPGFEPGSELSWGTEAGGPQPMAIPISYFRYVLFKNPNWSFRMLNFDSNVKLADRQDGPVMNAINPDLHAFRDHGGKLIMYHGWSDPLIAPLESVDYYKNVVAAMGGLNATQRFARLFMVPGMLHCGGGPGPDSWDKVGVLDEWVDQGKAPDKIIASHTTHGRVDMTRPLCPYPQVARWKRYGGTNDAANFVCVSPDAEPVN